jgi:hypothetical protein
MTPLYRHTGPDTAYLVKDYPYGFRLRCQIRYWLERDGSVNARGWRFVSQTSNPKRSTPDKTVWNKPKCSTYSMLAGCLYLDEEGHVKWDGLNEYSDVDQVRRFAERFPSADMTKLRYWAQQKSAACEKFVQGELFMRMNGQPVELSEPEKQRYAEEAKKWDELYKMLIK